jgi:hypothetical protein
VIGFDSADDAKKASGMIKKAAPARKKAAAKRRSVIPVRKPKE